LPEKHAAPRGPKKDPPDRPSRDFRVHKLEKMFAGREGKKKSTVRQCKECAAHKKQSETRHM
jgi:hypothetical protein